MSESRSEPGTHSGWAPLVAVCLGTFMLLLDVWVVNVTLPQMALDLHASFVGLQWVVDVYALALAALLLIIGSVSDAVGHRRTYVIGLVIFVVASLASGLAPSEGVLVLARGIQGIGAAAMYATTIALINASYSGAARSTAFGIWAATNGAGAAAGPIVGGLLTQGLSWRWVFFVNVPIGLATIIVARRTLPEAPSSGRARVDWPGGASFTLFAAAGTFALVRAHVEGWTSAATFGVLAVALVALVTFAVVEWRSDSPLFDLRLLRGPLSGILIGSLLYNMSAFGMLVYASIWLQSVLGLGPIAAGAVTLPLSVVAFFVAAAGGRLAHAFPARAVLASGLALVGIGNLVQVGLGGGSGWSRLLLGLTLTGFGVGWLSPVLGSAAMAAVPRERSGMAGGAVNTARQLGSAFGIAVFGSIFSSLIASHLSSQGRGSHLAETVASGGAQGTIAHAPAATRVQLDAAVHNAVASALASTYLVAGIAGIVGAVLVFVLMRQRRGAAETVATPLVVTGAPETS